MDEEIKMCMDMIENLGNAQIRFNGMVVDTLGTASAEIKKLYHLIDMLSMEIREVKTQQENLIENLCTYLEKSKMELLW